MGGGQNRPSGIYAAEVPLGVWCVGHGSFKVIQRFLHTDTGLLSYIVQTIEYHQPQTHFWCYQYMSIPYFWWLWPFYDHHTTWPKVFFFLSSHHHNLSPEDLGLRSPWGIKLTSCMVTGICWLLANLPNVGAFHLYQFLTLPKNTAYLLH